MDRFWDARAESKARLLTCGGHIDSSYDITPAFIATPAPRESIAIELDGIRFRANDFLAKWLGKVIEQLGAKPTMSVPAALAPFRYLFSMARYEKPEAALAAKQ